MPTTDYTTDRFFLVAQFAFSRYLSFFRLLLRITSSICLFPQKCRKMWITVCKNWRNPYDTHLLRRRKRKNNRRAGAHLPTCRHRRQGCARAIFEKPANGRTQNAGTASGSRLSKRAAAWFFPEHERGDAKKSTRDA
ncbi:hypothetical protein SDC9_104759 [bioreactor metagenome]|uniref:Uncharacterized protein n=1 Tax=bioreactor metagenome TaxID=1076179 RepID=A0A645AXN9_9ZZZZ